MFGSSQQLFSTQQTDTKVPFIVSGTGAAPTQRTEETLRSLPTTIQAVQRAAKVAKPNDDDRLVFVGGQQAEVVILVAIVESISREAISVEMLLNDGTGRIKARIYGSGEEEALPGLQAGSYVSVAANVRLTPELHVSVINASAVKSPDEVSYHLIACCHAALKSMRAQQEAPSSFKAVADTPSPKRREKATLEPTPSKDLTVAAPAAVRVPEITAATGGLPAAVRRVLEGPGRDAGDGGLTVAQLLAHLGAGAKASEGDVRAVLQGLVDEGEIFNTIDDDHFALI